MGDDDRYWDLDDILADQQEGTKARPRSNNGPRPRDNNPFDQRVPVFFQTDVPDYGFLEGNNEEHISQLSKDTRVELPFWLAEPLALREIVELEVPRCFGPHIRNDLRASPTAVPLHALNQFYYAFGMKMVDLPPFRTEDAPLSQILSTAFTTRLIQIMKYCHANVGPDRDEFLQRLDETEKKREDPDGKRIEAEFQYDVATG
ncbi:hypothetical protein DFJ73DRAFT_780440 [Zopfochytrium polystomum]|nr:hypothetical protein DFJ73DRAFT_780440 [Zopfochytrium polystomum]